MSRPFSCATFARRCAQRPIEMRQRATIGMVVYCHLAILLERLPFCNVARKACRQTKIGRTPLRTHGKEMVNPHGKEMVNEVRIH